MPDVPRRAWWLVAAVVVVAAGATAIVVATRGDGTNDTALPALAQGPGTYRVHAVPNTSTGGANVTYPPNVDVGGVRALVLLRGVDGSGTPVARMQISVGQSTTDGSRYAAHQGCDCRAGQQVTVGALTFRVLHVWQRSGDGHDAVDLKVTAAS